MRFLPTLLLALGSVAIAAEGDPDTSFGTNGVTSWDIAPGSTDESAQAMTVGPDGSLAVVGYADLAGNRDLTVARLTATGALDTAFNGTGWTTLAVGNGADEGRAVVIQVDGKVVVAGFTSDGSTKNLLVARYTTTGALDAGFATNGIWRSSWAGWAESLVLLGDGSFVVGGTKGEDGLLMKLTPGGVLDSTWGVNGEVVIPGVANYRVSDYGSIVRQVALDAANRLVVAIRKPSSNTLGALRYSAAGVLDSSWPASSFDGSAMWFSSTSTVDLVLEGDGAIVLRNGNNAVARRIRADGTGDPTFQPSSWYGGIARIGDGRFFVGSSSISRFRADGSADETLVNKNLPNAGGGGFIPGQGSPQVDLSRKRFLAAGKSFSYVVYSNVHTVSALLTDTNPIAAFSSQGSIGVSAGIGILRYELQFDQDITGLTLGA